MLYTVKISVDFTVKYLATSCQSISRYFLQAPVNISGIRHRTVAKDTIVFFFFLSFSPTRVGRKTLQKKLTQLSSIFHPRHLVGKRTAQKDTVIDTTSDSQVNSNFLYRWSPASLTFNNYFYLFLYLYITRITINNNAPHLKSPKNQNRRTALGRPAIKITGGGGGGGGGNPTKGVGGEGQSYKGIFEYCRLT